MVAVLVVAHQGLGFRIPAKSLAGSWEVANWLTTLRGLSRGFLKSRIAFHIPTQPRDSPITATDLSGEATACVTHATEVEAPTAWPAALFCPTFGSTQNYLSYGASQSISGSFCKSSAQSLPPHSPTTKSLLLAGTTLPSGYLYNLSQPEPYSH